MIAKALVLAVAVAAFTKIEAVDLKCGSPKIPPYSRIVGGKDAKPHSWPWQVALCFGPSIDHCNAFCGGSIISKKYVLTAAHCPLSIDNDPNEVTVKIGAHLMSESTTQVRVSRIEIHPKYESPKGNSNDVALLELAKELDFSDEVSPVCIPGTDDSVKTHKFYVTGWGLLEDGGSSSNTLQQVLVPFVPIEECKEPYGTSIDSSSMLCLGIEEGGKDSCQGDSGGPAVTKVAGRFYQFGIVSFGYGCALPGKPGVYARVSSFCDFIIGTTGENICVNFDGSPVVSTSSVTAPTKKCHSEINGRCLFLVNELRDHDGAIRKCKELGGQLASKVTSAEHWCIISNVDFTFGTATLVSYWLSLEQDKGEPSPKSGWFWRINGNKVPLKKAERRWRSGEPNDWPGRAEPYTEEEDNEENYAEEYYDGSWNDKRANSGPRLPLCQLNTAAGMPTIEIYLLTPNFITAPKMPAEQSLLVNYTQNVHL